MAKPINFGDHYFTTKTAAIKEIQSRINKYDFGSKISYEDQLFFSQLFTLHSEYSDKIGAGIEHISVEKDFHRNRNLYIHRKDGSKIDISWRHCLQPISKKTTLLLAYRRAVKDIIISYRNNQIDNDAHCPFLNVKLTARNSHVIYPETSFDILVSEFLGTIDCDLYGTELENPSPEDDDQRGILRDKTLEARWRAYHEQNAVLKMISASAHYSRAS